MPNPSTTTARRPNAGSPVKRTSSFKKTLTSMLGSSSSSSSTPLQRRATASGPHGASVGTAPNGNSSPARTRATPTSQQQSTKRTSTASEPKRSNTVGARPRVSKKTSGSFSTQESPTPRSTASSTASSVATTTTTRSSTATTRSSTATTRSSTNTGRSGTNTTSTTTTRSTNSGTPRPATPTKTRSSPIKKERSTKSVSKGTPKGKTPNSTPRGSVSGSATPRVAAPPTPTPTPRAGPATPTARTPAPTQEDEAALSGQLISAPPPPPSAKEFLREYLTQRGLLRPRAVFDRPELRISIASSGDHVFLPTMSCNDDEYLARLNGFRDDEEFDVLDTAESRVNNGDGGNHRGPPRANSNGNLRSRSSMASLGANGHRSSHNPFRTGSLSAGSLSSRAGFEMDDSMAPMTVAVILSLPKPTKISTVEVQLCSRIRIHWYAGVPPTKSFNEENYSAGSLNWSLNTENMNVFIPSNVSSKEKIIENNRNVRQLSLFRNNPDHDRIYLERGRTKKELIRDAMTKKPQTLQAGDYVYIIPVAFANHIPESLYLPSARVHYRFCIASKMMDGRNRALSLQQQRALQEERAADAESNGHKKFGLLKKIKGHSQNSVAQAKDLLEDANDIYIEHPIYVIRTPPPISISTANKPIYIDRVWTDSLAYEISFAKKYVSLDSKVPVKIRLQPLTSNVYVKRVRMSVVEKITFVSKNYEFEYDQVDPVARDPYNPYFNEFAAKRKKERSLSLLEIRTRDKGSRAVREEIVENCADDNLLSYRRDGSVDTLAIETSLDFPCYEDLDKNTAKNVPPYGVDAYANITNPESTLQHNQSNNTPTRRSSVIGFLSNRRNSMSPTPKHSNSDLRKRQSFSPQPSPASHSDPRFHETILKSGRGVPVKYHTRLNKPRRGLYLDSLHFTNIHSRHKLEIMLRISKPDPIEPAKMRHYEVLIDTPIFLISEKCSEGNMELPTYSDAINDPLSPTKPSEMIAPPTFEEAISVPASPMQSPLGSPVVSPLASPAISPMVSPLVSPHGSPQARSVNLAKDSDIQHLSLGSTPNLQADGSSSHPPPATPVANSKFTESNYMFNNLDKLMSSPNSVGERSDDGETKLRETKQSNGSRNHGEAMYRSSEYMRSEDLDMTRPNFHKRPDGTVGTAERVPLKSKKGLTAEPPRYDDVVALTNDEE
ncbi:uncharacterized protein ZBAI_08331 [Zygosaccharomyces bailii ISA1307]|nr:uncharacterized protein ZBAI_08331 [Zygosaccharomyces bailii ISA1307]